MAHLLIVELPGGNDVDLIRAAVERGDSFSFLTADLAHYLRQPLVNTILALAQQIIEVPGFDYAKVERAVLTLHAGRPVDAVLCLIDIRLIEAARLAQALGLKHISPDTAELLRDKYRVRRRLADQGLIQPDFALADSPETLHHAVDTLGLPVVIKPADGYGSQNIVLLENALDLDPWLNPLDNMLPCHADYGLGVRANDRLLVERRLQGQVIGCDTFSVNGEHRLLGVNDKLFFEPPSFAIRGGCFTPNQGQFADIERYVFATLDALGFNWGATHTELMLTPEGPRLIEVNARLVGAKIPRLLTYAMNRSVHADLIEVHLGQWPERPATAELKFATTRWLVAEEAGTLSRIDLPLDDFPGLRSVEMLKHAGDPVRAPLENADRIGYVMVTGHSREQAEQVAAAYIESTQLSLLEHNKGRRRSRSAQAERHRSASKLQAYRSPGLPDME